MRTNGQGCCSKFALFLLLRILSLRRRSNVCGTARPRAGFSLLVIGWRFPMALTCLSVAPFLWQWGSFHPLLLFFGQCVGILQGSIFWITCWEWSIRFPCNWKPITLLNVDFLKLFISLWPMTRLVGCRKACKSLAFGSWFTSFPRVLPTSNVGYHAGKPIESVIFLSLINPQGWYLQFKLNVNSRRVSIRCHRFKPLGHSIVT